MLASARWIRFKTASAPAELDLANSKGLFPSKKWRSSRKNVFHPAPGPPMGSCHCKQHATQLVQPFAVFSREPARLLRPSERCFRYPGTHNPLPRATHCLCHRLHGAGCKSFGNTSCKGYFAARARICDRQQPGNGSCLAGLVRKNSRRQVPMTGVCGNPARYLYLLENPSIDDTAAIRRRLANTPLWFVERPRKQDEC